MYKECCAFAAAIPIAHLFSDIFCTKSVCAFAAAAIPHCASNQANAFPSPPFMYKVDHDRI